LRNGAGGYLSTVDRRQGGKRMSMWLWVLIIVLLVLLLVGGVGYGRRGTRV
jgi:flagellar basal body-associated protein FliL